MIHIFAWLIAGALLGILVGYFLNLLSTASTLVAGEGGPKVDVGPNFFTNPFGGGVTGSLIGLALGALTLPSVIAKYRKREATNVQGNHAEPDTKPDRPRD
jgi:hypothetical protein